MENQKVPEGRIDELILGLLARPMSGGALAASVGRTPQAVNARLRRMADSGLVERRGAGRGSTWHRRWALVVHAGLDPSTAEEEVWDQVLSRAPQLHDLDEATMRTLRYAVTEMVNNAIDHSRGTWVEVRVDPVDPVVVEVHDDGIGALPNVRELFHLADDFEAIAWLDSGRQTTDPARHSGQGLFFTSKAVSRFTLTSGSATWIVDNRQQDRSVTSSPSAPGTVVHLELDRRWPVRLKDVFDEFSDPETFDFDRTTIHVRLAEFGKEFVSRSEAKRIGAQLEPFRRAVIDFRDVVSVGQGFVDELFRVLPDTRPDLELIPLNANEAVTFMLRRGLGRTELR